jgi:serine phosphatase RsbU (regulator of sigma subunit)
VVVDLPAGSLVFVTTDGLVDQVGGPRAIAFGKRRLCELLLGLAKSTPEHLNRDVHAALQEWQGEHHRRDDVTFFCFRT